MFGALALLSLSLSLASADHVHHARNHYDIAKRMTSDIDVYKRDAYANSRFTFFEVGQGACGIYNVDSDFIVALNTPQYTENGYSYPGPECFKWITIQVGNKQTQAQITDECPGCPWGGLDMSPGLFKYFADEGVGVLYGTWWFDGDGEGNQGNVAQASSSAWVAPTTTTQAWTPPANPSTSQWVAPTTTTTWAPSSSSTSATSPPAASGTHASEQVLGDFNQIFLAMGAMVAAASHH